MLKRLMAAAAIRNSIWMILEKVFRLCLGILVSALLARHLGPSGFGELNFALAILAIALTFSGLGLNRIIVREVVFAISDERQQSEMISTAFFLKLAVSVVLAFSIYIFFCFSPDADAYLWGVIFFSLIFSPVNIVDLHQQGLSDVKMVSVVRSVVVLISSVLKISLIYFEALEKFGIDTNCKLSLLFFVIYFK